MPEGSEIRDVIQSRGPSGGANTPARQAGLVGVTAPRGGDMSQVGSAERALGQVAKMGGQLFDGYMKKKKAEDDVKGEMLYQQGKTEKDLSDAGYNKTVLKGFQSLKLKTGFSQWYSKMSHDAINEFSTMDPEQYRQDVLSPQFKEVLDGLDPNDALARELFTEFGKDGFSRLVEKQTVANVQFLDADSITTVSNMIASTAGTGEPDLVKDVVNNLDVFTQGMSTENKQKAVLDGMVPQINQGNFMFYDEMGGEEGLREKGFTPAQLQTIKKAVEVGQTKMESIAGSELDDSIDDIMMRSKRGELGPEQALELTTQLQDQYRLSEDWKRGIVKSVRKEAFNQKYEAKDLEILHDPRYVQIMSQFSMKAEAEGNTADTTNTALLIAEKFNLPHDMVMDNLKMIRQAEGRKLQGDLNKVKSQNAKIEKQREVDSKAITALSNDTLFNESADVQQRAMDIKRDQIMQGSSNKEAGINKHIDFLKSTSVIDNVVKNDFIEASASAPLVDGKLTEEAESSLDYFIAMKQGGLSEASIRKYTGSSYDYYSAASYLQNGSLDPSMAMMGAWEATKVPSKDKVASKAKVQEMRGDFEDEIDTFFDDIEPSVWESMTGSAAEGKFYEVLTSEVKEAAEGSKSMQNWIQDRAEHYADVYPNMRSDAIFNMTKRDLSRWEYVGGTLIKPMNGKSFSEVIGIAGMGDDLAANRAVLDYVNDFKDELMPEGSDPRGTWDKFFDGVSDVVVDATLAVPRRVFNPSYVFEERKRKQKNMTPMDITLMSGGNVMLTMYYNDDRDASTSIVVAGDSIGKNYIRNKNLSPVKE